MWFDYAGKQKGYKPFAPNKKSVSENVGKRIVYITRSDCDNARGWFIPRYGVLETTRYSTLFLEGGTEVDMRNIIECGIEISTHPTPEIMERELLYCWSARVFNVLVPKKRGKGFLRQPYGHHHNQELTAIADMVQCDVFGLDGALEFEVSGDVYWDLAEGRKEFCSTVVPALEKYYGIKAREISELEFIKLHPIQ